MNGWVLVGPTASGKTDVAHVLARRMQLPVLSADAMLVYRGLNVGTAKPAPAERAGVEYFGIDLVPPSTRFSAGAYRDAVRAQLSEAGLRRDRGCIVVGGTGLYVRALIEGLDRPPPAPEHRARTDRLLREGGVDALHAALERAAPGRLAGLSDPGNPRRVARALEQAWARGPETNFSRPRSPRGVLAGLRRAVEDLSARIERRAAAMFEHGLLDEVRRLPADPDAWSETARHAIGYREAHAVVSGTITVAQAVERTIVRTRALARRQRTWFRHQAQVYWIDVACGEAPEHTADRVAAAWERHGPIKLQL